jgi:hypothetical protein
MATTGEELLQAIDQLADKYPQSTLEVMVADIDFRGDVLQEITVPTELADATYTRRYTANDWLLKYSPPDLEPRHRHNHILTFTDILTETGIQVTTEHMIQWKLGTLWTGFDIRTTAEASDGIRSSVEGVAALAKFLKGTHNRRGIETSHKQALGILGALATQKEVCVPLSTQKYPGQRGLVAKVSSLI